MQHEQILPRAVAERCRFSNNKLRNQKNNRSRRARLCTVRTIAGTGIDYDRRTGVLLGTGGTGRRTSFFDGLLAGSFLLYTVL